MIVAVAPGRVVVQRVRRIGSRDELAELARVPLYASLAPEPPLALVLPELDRVESQRWEVRLNREWVACGCRSGEIAAVIAIAGYALAALVGMAPEVASLWGHVGRVTLAALIAAAAGKVVGRHRSLVQFRRLVRQLDAALPCAARISPNTTDRTDN